MKILTIARKTLLENWREPQLLLLFLFFPAMLVLTYYLAYGPSAMQMSNFLKLMVVNEDEGPLGVQLIDALRAETFEGQPVFQITQIASAQEAENALMEARIAALIIIPTTFSQEAQNFSSESAPVALQLTGDPASDQYVFARGFLSGVVQAFADQLQGSQEALDLEYQFVEGTGKLSDFQFGIPGTIVFGVIFGIISSAMLLVRDDVKGTLQRLRLSRANAIHLLLGIALAVTVEAIPQVLITFGVALLCGFRGNGSIFLAMGVAMVLSLAACGLGFITACFAKNDGEAANIGSLWMIPMVFLSGAVFPMPPLPIFSLFGQTVNLYDLMPSTLAAEALRRIMIYGDGTAVLIYELVGTTVLSFAYLAAGIWLYQQLRLKQNFSIAKAMAGLKNTLVKSKLKKM